ncbi:hypothetical protein ABUV18_03059 (plasmid) [Clavibacter nebraskensis]
MKMWPLPVELAKVTGEHRRRLRRVRVQQWNYTIAKLFNFGEGLTTEAKQVHFYIFAKLSNLTTNRSVTFTRSERGFI